MSFPLSLVNHESSEKTIFNLSPVSTSIAYPGNQPIPFLPLPSFDPFLSTEGLSLNPILSAPPSAKSEFS